MKEQNSPKFGLSMPQTPCNNLLHGHINGFEFFQIFLVLILSCFPLPTEGTTAGFRHLAVVICAPATSGAQQTVLHLQLKTTLVLKRFLTHNITTLPAQIWL